MAANVISGESVFRFDGFRLDRRGGLSRQRESGQRDPVTLGSRALDVLIALVERHGELVPKQALMDAA
jgi:DNA-binding winged helix-turn-helix (wHTH) protein